MPNYRALVGIDHGGNRYEAGDEISGKIPAWLIEQGLVEEVAAPAGVAPSTTEKDGES